MLMDAWIWRQCAQPYDKDAAWAKEGQVILPLLQRCCAIRTLLRRRPKSTGREYFNYGWLERHLTAFLGADARDVQATLAELTAVSIAQQVLLNGGCERLMVCGGGSRNPLVMARLAALLPGIEVSTTDKAGSAAMIWKRWPLHGLLANARGPAGKFTFRDGATEASVLGAIYPANPITQS